MSVLSTSFKFGHLSSMLLKTSYVSVLDLVLFGILFFIIYNFFY